MDTSKRLKRLDALIEIVENTEGNTIKSLSASLNVSEMTVRRDLDLLRYKGINLSFNGFVISDRQKNEEAYSLSLASRTHVNEKSAIGKAAANLIKDGDCVIIDNGTTVEYLAKNISGDIKIMALTCNLNVLNMISANKNIEIVFGGGYYHADTALFESAESISLIKKSRANKVFISAAGIHENLGITCSNRYEVETKRAILELGAEKIALIDSSKFGVVKPFFFSDINQYDKIITDSLISSQWIEIIKDIGVELVVI